MRARSLMFLLNLFLLRLWLGSRVGPRLSSHSVLVYGASFSICSLVSRSHQIQPQPLVHLLSEREREKKKDWVRYVFLPRRPTSHYRLAARMKPRKFWCAYFSSKHWYLFQAAEGKLKTTVGSSSISFSLSFLFLIAHPKQARSQFVALNIHFQTSNKVRFQIKGGNLKDIKCPILHRFQLFF